jgi:hypothetical protein
MYPVPSVVLSQLSPLVLSHPLIMFALLMSAYVHPSVPQFSLVAPLVLHVLSTQYPFAVGGLPVSGVVLHIVPSFAAAHVVPSSPSVNVIALHPLIAPHSDPSAVVPVMSVVAHVAPAQYPSLVNAMLGFITLLSHVLDAAHVE